MNVLYTSKHKLMRIFQLHAAFPILQKDNDDTCPSTNLSSQFSKAGLHMFSTTLVSPSSSHLQETQQQFGYFPTNHLAVEKHEPNRCVTKQYGLMGLMVIKDKQQ